MGIPPQNTHNHQLDYNEWTLLISHCKRRKIPVSRIVQRSIYGTSELETLTCDDEQTVTIRRAIMRELKAEGLSTPQIASMMGLTTRAVRKAFVNASARIKSC